MASYNLLTNVTLKAIREPGLHLDGRGLYVRVDQAGGRFWVLIFKFRGRRREMGLGSLIDVDLKEARHRADDARRLLRDGIDPIETRREERAAVERTPFARVASDLMDDLEPTWRSAKQRPQWEASLKQHAPTVWRSSVTDVDTEMVLRDLRKVWTSRPETARRVRNRIERILDAATAKGLRTGDNPARWKGHLDKLLPATKRGGGHHAAMPYQGVPAFIEMLATRKSVSAFALAFLIFTAARSGEVRGAVWEEIDGDVWAVPAARMKAGAEHRVPLSEAALSILARVDRGHRSGLIFPGLKGPLSDMALAMVVRKMGVTDATPHGFRSAFKDWAVDCTSFADEISEEALAHTVGSAVRRAYRRGQAMEKRRALMEAWSDFCTGKAGSVTPFQKRA